MIQTMILIAALHHGNGIDPEYPGSAGGLPTQVPEIGFKLGAGVIGSTPLLDIRLIKPGEEVPAVGVFLEMESARVLLGGIKQCEVEREDLRNTASLNWMLVTASVLLGAGVTFGVLKATGALR